MKFYDSIGPNPRLVRTFLAEKNVSVPNPVAVDLMGGENRQQPYLAKNPAGQLPALELDDGRVVAETIALCEYFEEQHPEPTLIGANPEDRVNTRMWVRRVEWKIIQPMTDAFRFGVGAQLFKGRIRIIPQAADDLKAVAIDGLGWLDQQIAGRDWIAGPDYTLADIALFAFAEFGASVGQPIPDELSNLHAWYARVAERPAVAASAKPSA